MLKSPPGIVSLVYFVHSWKISFGQSLSSSYSAFGLCLFRLLKSEQEQCKAIEEKRKLEAKLKREVEVAKVCCCCYC